MISSISPRPGELNEGSVKPNMTQADARYLGAEARLDIVMRRDLWLNLGFDAVDAQLKD